MARKTKSSLKAKPVKKAPKRGDKKSSAKRTAPARGASARTDFYFAGHNFDPVITNGKSSSGTVGLKFDSFETARDGAIDQLIEIIDRCEARLWQLKRARTFAEYQQLSSS